MASTTYLTRKFKFKDLQLEDPNPSFTLKQVLDFY